METTIRIDGRDVRFKATAAVPMLYRRQFKRDMLTDMRRVAQAMDRKAETGEDIPVELLSLFEHMAYIMARHADPNMKASSPEEWLDGFQTLSIYSIFPIILALWTGNMECLVEIKKKLELLTET